MESKSNSNYRALGMNAALEKEEKRKRRSRLVVIISVGVLLVLIAVGVTVGVIVSKNNSKEKSSSSGVTGGRTGGGTGTGPPTAVITGDPSVFKADSRLKKSFYGLAYTPEGSLPDYGCSIQLPNVIQDVQLMSQMTKRIRLYGSDCNQTAMVLEAVKQTKVDLQVFVGNYVVADDHDAYLRQREAIKEAIETYGTDHIGGVTVGNEFMLNWVVGHNSLDANSAIANQGAAILKADIEDTRDMLAAMGHGNLPVGNSDAGSFFNDEIMSSIDYGMSNVHAWFANTTAEAAAAWVNEFFEENNVRPAALLPNNPRMYIAETGWPTASSDAANAHNGPGGGSASVEGLQTFLDTFVCEANANGVGYFFFEFKDEEWKDIKYGGVEGHWGIFDKNKVMKDVVLPDCVAP